MQKLNVCAREDTRSRAAAKEADRDVIYSPNLDLRHTTRRTRYRKCFLAGGRTERVWVTNIPDQDDDTISSPGLEERNSLDFDHFIWKRQTESWVHTRSLFGVFMLTFPNPDID